MAFWTALSFLTVLPTPVKPTFSSRDLGRAVGYFPLVGLVVGFLLVLGARGLAFVYPPYVAAAGVLVLWVGSTGALHVDGFLDACDGLFGGHSPEERLRIMRDSRIGSFAFVGGILLFLLKYTAVVALLSLSPRGGGPLWGMGDGWGSTLLLAPVWGRAVMSFAIVAFPYARAEGLGRVLKDEAGRREGFLAGGFSLLLSLALGGVKAGVVWLALAGMAWGIASWVMRRIPGLTGDVYGALCEVSEVMGMLIMYALH